MMVEKGLNEPVIMEWGDIDVGFKEADVVIEDKVEVKPQIHSPIEPHICIAGWKGDELTLWTATQSPYEVRMSIAYALGMPEGKVRVIYGRSVEDSGLNTSKDTSRSQHCYQKIQAENQRRFF